MSDDSKRSGSDLGSTMLGTGTGVNERKPEVKASHEGPAISGKTMLGTGSQAGAAPSPVSGIAATVASRPGEAPAPQPADDHRFVGRELGGYRIERKLAEGGMGVVFLAEHTQIGKRAAVKVLKPEHCQNEKTVERFYQEARAVNSIRHPNIVDIFDFGRDEDGRVFFVMELLDGESLDDRIRRGPVPWREAKTILDQVIAALAAAHAQEIVHRDLKPENIFLRRGSDGEVSVRLLDFGIAKFLDHEDVQDKLTRTGSLIGTPQYMSPEQINGDAAIDGRSDIYSLGVIIHEMLTGRRPFEGETLGAVIRAHLLSEPPALVAPDTSRVPPQIGDVVRRMLAKKVADRYATLAEVASDLEDVHANRPPTHAGTLNQTRPLINETEITAPPPPRSRLGLYLGLGAGLVAAGALVAFLVVPGDSGSKGSTAAQAESGAAETGNEAPAEPAIDPEKARGEAQKVLAGSLAETEPELRIQGADAYGELRDGDAVEPLKNLVEKDPDAEVKAHAAEALGLIGDEGVSELLAGVGARAEPPLQIWIDAALARLGDKKARRRLVKASKSKELPVATKATFALADLSEGGDRDAVAALTRLASREAELNDVVPHAGIQILGRLARHRHGKARELLYAALEEPDEGLRLAAARSLAKLGDDGGKKVLAAIVADKSSPNRIAAARGLAVLGDYSGFDLMKTSLDAKETAARRQAASGLGEIGEADALRDLLDAIADTDKSVQIAAAVAVLRIVGLSVKVLAQASVDWTKSALESEDSAQRAAGARALGDIPQAQSLPLLAQAIADPEPEVRLEASRSAAKIKTKASAKKVAEAVVVEKNVEVKVVQVKTLATLKEPETKTVLQTIAEETGRLGVLASGALIALGETEAIARLDEAVRDRSKGIRIAAVESAGMASDPVVVGTLSHALEDRVFEVRLAAAETLSEYKAQEDVAVKVLEEALEKKNPELQARAQAALLRYGRQISKSPAELLASADPAVRIAAIAAIEAMAWSDAESLLRRAVRDSDDEVRRRAMEAISTFEKSSSEGVIRLYKSLVRSTDPLIRTKAQGRLSQLVEKTQATVITAKPAPKVDDAQAVAKLREAAEQVRAARGEFDKAAAGLEALTANVVKRTAKPAKDDAELEEVERLTRDLDAALAAAKTTRGSFRDRVARARNAGVGLTGDESQALIAEIDKIAVEVGGRIGEAMRQAAKASERAAKYSQEETADPNLYLTSAQTAIATGNLGAARRDLRKAQELFRAQGRVPADLHYAYGELYSKLARSASGAEQRKHLEKAIDSFKRYVASGKGFKVQRAREQIGRLEQKLAE